MKFAISIFLWTSVAAAAPRKVAIVVYPGVELLDFAGPGEVFSAAGNGAFDVFTVAATTEPLVSQGFVKIVPQYSIASSPKPDIIVVPGGNAASVYDDPKMMAWLTRAAGQSEITMSVCNGAIVLARAGLLDGLKATTHFGAVPSLRKFPKVTVVPGERFVDNGHIVSTQGVSAGIDGALHLVQRLLGAEEAWSTARYMMYHWEPAGLSKENKAELQPWIEQDWAAVAQVNERKLAAHPEDVVAMMRLGVAQEGLGRHEQAAATLDRAIALGSHDPNAYDGLGDARFALGQFEAAARAYEQELPLRSPHMRPWIQLGIAKSWARANRKEAAVAALKQACATGAIRHAQIAGDPDLANLRDDPRVAHLFANTAETRR